MSDITSEIEGVLKVQRYGLWVNTLQIQVWVCVHAGTKKVDRNFPLREISMYHVKPQRNVIKASWRWSCLHKKSSLYKATYGRGVCVCVFVFVCVCGGSFRCRLVWGWLRMCYMVNGSLRIHFSEDTLRQSPHDIITGLFLILVWVELIMSTSLLIYHDLHYWCSYSQIHTFDKSMKTPE